MACVHPGAEDVNTTWRASSFVGKSRQRMSRVTPHHPQQHWISASSHSHSCMCPSSVRQESSFLIQNVPAAHVKLPWASHQPQRAKLKYFLSPNPREQRTQKEGNQFFGSWWKHQSTLAQLMVPQKAAYHSTTWSQKESLIIRSKDYLGVRFPLLLAACPSSFWED